MAFLTAEIALMNFKTTFQNVSHVKKLFYQHMSTANSFSEGKNILFIIQIALNVLIVQASFMRNLAVYTNLQMTTVITFINSLFAKIVLTQLIKRYVLVVISLYLMLELEWKIFFGIQNISFALFANSF